MTIKINTRNITPKQAQAMLDMSITLGATNRRVAQKHIDLYAREMAEGRWKLNGVAIKLDENGAVLDGQHRLLACIKAGVPFQTIVMTGVPRETFDTLDCGRPRTVSQVLQMSDVKYHSLVAAVIRGVAEMRMDGNTAQKEKRISNSAAMQEYQTHSAEYDDSARFGAVAVADTHAMTPKLVATLHYYLVNDLKLDRELVERFLGDIVSFDTSSIAVADKLRKWNLQNRNMRVSERTRLGYTILTWNAMLKKSKCPRFCEKAIEEMPKFLTK